MATIKSRVITILRYASDNRRTYTAEELAEQFGLDHYSIEAIVEVYNENASVKVSLAES